MGRWARCAAIAICVFGLGTTVQAATPWFFAEDTDANGAAYGYAQVSNVDGHAWLFAECAAGEKPILALFVDADTKTVSALDGVKTVLTFSSDAADEVRGIASYNATSDTLLGVSVDKPENFAPALDLFSAAQRRISVDITSPHADLPGSIKFPARGSTDAVNQLKAYCGNLE